MGLGSHLAYKVRDEGCISQNDRQQGGKLRYPAATDDALQKEPKLKEADPLAKTKRDHRELQLPRKAENERQSRFTRHWWDLNAKDAKVYVKYELKDGEAVTMQLLGLYGASEAEGRERAAAMDCRAPPACEGYTRLTAQVVEGYLSEHTPILDIAMGNVAEGSFAMKAEAERVGLSGSECL